MSDEPKLERVEKLYPWGGLDSICHFSEGSQEGLAEFYHANGALKVRENYVKGRKHGPCQEWYDNGHLRSEGAYKDDEKDGVWVDYHQEAAASTKEKEVCYVLGKRHGLYAYWDPQGVLQVEESYENDQLSGPKRVYTAGVLTELQTWANGTRDGWQMDYFADGTLQSAHHIKNQQLHGPSVSYHKNNQIEKATCYQEGREVPRLDACLELLRSKAEELHIPERMLREPLEETVKETFRNDGSVHESIAMKGDQKHGPYTLYYPDGKLAETGAFEMGQLQGVVLAFHKNGALWISGEYDKGLLHGTEQTFLDTAVLEQAVSFERGQATKRVIYWQNGAVMQEATYEKERFVIATFYDTGDREFEGLYLLKANMRWDKDPTPWIRGKADGTHYWWHVAGSLSQEEVWIKGEVQESSHYDYEGIKRMYRQFEKGTLALMRTFDEKGMLSGEERYYADGSRRPSEDLKN